MGEVADKICLLRTEEVAKRLGLTPRTVLIGYQEGWLPEPVIDRPRVKRWNPTVIERFIQTGRLR